MGPHPKKRNGLTKSRRKNGEFHANLASPGLLKVKGLIKNKLRYNERRPNPARKRFTGNDTESNPLADG